MKCQFCSASNLDTHDMSKDDVCRVIDSLNEKFAVKSISLEGGEPTSIGIKAFTEIVEEVSKRYPDIGSIGMTTNLWNFYKRPEVWTEIFRHPLLDICTSFQYGNKRRFSETKILDEQTFRRMYDLFKTQVGKPLPFISVIDEDNEDSVLKTVLLAKELNTSCKINPTLPQGRSTVYYPIHKMIEKWADIICSGLGQYEDNCRYLIDAVKGNTTSLSCPFNHNCTTLYACDNLGRLTTCSIYRDYHSTVKFYDKKIMNPKKDPFMSVLKPECYTCDKFDICNGCRVHIGATKTYSDVETHCESVKQSYDRILRFLNEQNNTN